MNGFQFNSDSLNLLKSSVAELLEYTVQSRVLMYILISIIIEILEDKVRIQV